MNRFEAITIIAIIILAGFAVISWMLFEGGAEGVKIAALNITNSTLINQTGNISGCGNECF